MSPIKDLSDIRRMPRLGKVRLGIKVEPEGKKPLPTMSERFFQGDYDAAASYVKRV